MNTPFPQPNFYGTGALMAANVSVRVGKGNEKEWFPLSPRVRTHCTKLGNLPHGSTIRGTPARAFKALIAHRDGDSNFNHLSIGEEKVLRMTEVWILAGQLNLFSVQNELLSVYRDHYIQKRKLGKPIRVPAAPFDYVRKLYDAGTELRIPDFLLNWYAGLHGRDLGHRLKNSDLRSTDRHDILATAERNRYYGKDPLVHSFNRFKVSLERGDSVNPTSLKIEHPPQQQDVMQMQMQHQQQPQQIQ
ncbi:hypothetical protein BDV95DRAFT_594500 [Massariosphaeria phaeospora]|uniref:Uncharacterized protein n=1 Tax=Massariosphaeria phaeospora TaxID=100035 RepID=A0A7C8MBM0_9PLEO|nr:hypothetical protein BDV95DRAFT_594500 [Massariosphaeria phaeospora]